MAAALACTDWELAGHRFRCGSSWSDPYAVEPERIVAARAGHLFLSRHRTTGQWASLTVPHVFIVSGDIHPWDTSDGPTRINWLAHAVIEGSVVAPDLGGVLDVHERRVTDADNGDQVSNPDFAACSAILGLQHPDAEPVVFLAALGSWLGVGMRGVPGQPLLGRVRDVEFLAMSGARKDETGQIITAWLARRDLTVQIWASFSALTRGRDFDLLPAVLPAVTEASWSLLVEDWCAVHLTDPR